MNSASEISQRYNVIVYSLYAVGVGRAARSSWDLLNWPFWCLTKLADEKPAATAFLSALQLLVSFKTLSGSPAENVRQPVLRSFPGYAG